MKARIVELSDGRYRMEVNDGGAGMSPWRPHGLKDSTFGLEHMGTYKSLVDEINRPPEPPPTVVRVVYP